MTIFGELNIQPVQDKIREIFLKRIIYAKGISKISDVISDILMPTPSAVMKGIELLSQGYEDEGGLGELMAFDLGGATTDVYSVASGFPEKSNVIYKGIKEPYIKRTVEGDIGMRYSAQNIVDQVGINKIAKLINLSEDKVEKMIDYLVKNPETIPKEKEFLKLDFILSSKAIEIACLRHCGTKEEIYTSNGIAYLQNGKDLTQIKKIIATGGSLIYLHQTYNVIKNALFNDNNPQSLRPKNAEILVDEKYILSAMGLLSKSYPKTAIRIMKKELKYDGNRK